MSIQKEQESEGYGEAKGGLLLFPCMEAQIVNHSEATHPQFLSIVMHYLEYTGCIINT